MEKKAKVPKLRFPGFAGDWEERKLGEVMERYKKPVATPHTGYNRLGIRSHAKGTFHNYVEAGEELETAQMYEVVANNFIVNITFAWEQAVAITDKADTGKLVSHRFPQFQFIAGNIPHFFKYVIADPRFKYHLGLASPGGAGRNRVLNISEMLKYVVRVPAREEQEQIGNFLGKVDENILFYQRKLTHLQAKKKSLLQKMFPKKGERVPEIRFPEFTDAWEQRKLGQVAKFSKGNGYSKDDLIDRGTPIILYGRMYTKYQTQINEVDDTFADKRANAVYSTGKEVIVPASGETAEDISVASAVMQPGILLGGDLNIVYPQEKLNSVFLALQMSNGNAKQEMSRRAQGKSIVHLHNTDLKEAEVVIPNLDEQKKITNFFNTLDNLITLHQRKLTHLQTQKKALLQQLFV